MNNRTRLAARLLTDRTRIMIGLLLVVVSIAAVAMSMISAARQRAYEECQADVYNKVITVLTDTRRVAAEERAATDQLFRDIRDNPRGFRSRLDVYLEARAAADRTRAQNPLPAPPAVACADAK